MFSFDSKLNMAPEKIKIRHVEGDEVKIGYTQSANVKLNRRNAAEGLKNYLKQKMAQQERMQAAREKIAAREKKSPRGKMALGGKRKRSVFDVSPDRISRGSPSPSPSKGKKRPKTKVLKLSGKYKEVRWAVGQKTEEGGSVFMARIAFPVTSKAQAAAAVSALRRDPAYKPTHNIAAYRLDAGAGKVLKWSDDDGETKAGAKLMAMLNRQEALNVVVVVSRWYGGKNIGPVRFTHIQERALALMRAHGQKKGVPMHRDWGSGYRLGDGSGLLGGNKVEQDNDFMGRKAPAKRVRRNNVRNAALARLEAMMKPKKKAKACSSKKKK